MSLGISSSYDETSWSEVSLGEEIDRLHKEIKFRDDLLKEVLTELKPNAYLKRNNLIKKIKKCITK